MKRLLAIFLILGFCMPAFAYMPTQRIKNPPVGSFKKAKNGTYVQYDNKGKKIGVYKIENNKLIKIK